MYACESGNDECVKVLLENGASVKCSVSVVNFLCACMAVANILTFAWSINDKYLCAVES